MPPCGLSALHGAGKGMHGAHGTASNRRAPIAERPGPLSAPQDDDTVGSETMGSGAVSSNGLFTVNVNYKQVGGPA